MTGVGWSERTLEEVGDAAAAGAIAILPVGATEQHGPHLPTGTDTLLAERAAAAAAAQTDDVCLPALAYGCSLGHTDHWPGTISLSPATLMAVIVDVGRWAYASGFRKLVLVNGHATNGPPCESALLQLRHELPDLRPRFVSIFDIASHVASAYTADAPDFHANAAETSMLLALEPDLVALERAVDEPDRTVGRVLRYPVPAVSASGVVGSPTKAAAADGRQLFEEIVDALCGLLRSARAEGAEPLAE